MKEKTEKQYNKIVNGVKDFWFEEYRTMNFKANPAGLIRGLDVSWDYQRKFAPGLPQDLIRRAMKEAARDIVNGTSGEIFPHYDTLRKTWRFFRLVEVWDDDLMLVHQNAIKEDGHRTTSVKDYDLIRNIHPQRLEEEVKLIDVKTPKVDGNNAHSRIAEIINLIRQEKHETINS